MCKEKDLCLLNEYKDFCFTKIETVSKMRDVSVQEFRSFWAREVSAEFGLNLFEIT